LLAEIEYQDDCNFYMICPSFSENNENNTEFDSFDQISAIELSDSVNQFKTLIQIFRKSLHI